LGRLLASPGTRAECGVWRAAPGRRQAELRAAVRFGVLATVCGVTPSARDTLGIVLVLLIALPVVVKLNSDRSRK
jgi:hypothetical protein